MGLLERGSSFPDEVEVVLRVGFEESRCYFRTQSCGTGVDADPCFCAFMTASRSTTGTTQRHPVHHAVSQGILAKTFSARKSNVFPFYIPSWLAGKVGQKIHERPNAISKLWQAMNG
jgi:hypothetical protein